MSQTACKQLRCCVVTPQKQVVDQEADFVILPAEDGQIGVLPDHAPLLCRLGPGLLRIDNGRDQNYYFINEGFVEILNNQVTILTPEVILGKDLIDQNIIQELNDAREQTMRTEEDRRKREKRVAAAHAKHRVFYQANVETLVKKK